MQKFMSTYLAGVRLPPLLRYVGSAGDPHGPMLQGMYGFLIGNGPIIESAVLPDRRMVPTHWWGLWGDNRRLGARAFCHLEVLDAPANAGFLVKDSYGVQRSPTKTTVLIRMNAPAMRCISVGWLQFHSALIDVQLTLVTFRRVPCCSRNQQVHSWHENLS